MSLLALLALIGPPSADSVHSSVVTATSAYQAGVPVTVALKIDLDPDWHVYWRNPGDSGIGTSVEWTLPKGWKASALRYPTPEKISLGANYGFSFGYEDEVVFLADLTPPAGAKGKVKVSAEMSLLACKTDCMPADQSFSFEMSNGGPDYDGGQQFPGWEAKIPVQLSAKSIKLTWAAKQYSFVVPAQPALKGASKLEFFSGDASLTNSEKPVGAVKQSDGSWKFTVAAGRSVTALPKELPFLVVPLDAKGERMNSGVEYTPSN